jgi:adenine-specific DNA glycosylase
MLQQTQVATVRDRFYSPFLNKFPTIAALAAAEQAEVMKAWEGLGYYSRARNGWKHEMIRKATKAAPCAPRITATRNTRKSR